MPPRVKICGLVRPEDAAAADALGADYLGVVVSAGFERSVEPRHAAAVVAGTKAAKVAVLVDETPDEAARRAEALGASVVQLHGSEGPEALAGLRELGPWTLWKAVRARTPEDVDEAARRYAAVADGILVEGWRAGVVGGGGARLTLDPKRVRAALDPRTDFVLAGGLTPDTVRDAVALFLPDVVDVSSGVEAGPRRKDPELIRRFLEAARSSDSTIAFPERQSQ